MDLAILDDLRKPKNNKNLNLEGRHNEAANIHEHCILTFRVSHC